MHSPLLARLPVLLFALSTNARVKVIAFGAGLAAVRSFELTGLMARWLSAQGRAFPVGS